MPESFFTATSNFEMGFTTKEGKSDRMFVDPKAFAALMGALIETSTTDLTINQFSYSDGTSPYPSVSHIQGKNGDLRYLRTDRTGDPVTVHNGRFDNARNSYLTTSLNKYGWNDMKSYKTMGSTGSNWILPFTSQLGGHHDHLHLQGFNPKISTVISPRHKK